MPSAGDGRHAVMPELLSAATAMEAVNDGDRIGVGGLLLARRPMSLVRALAARKVRELTVIGLTLSIESDLLVEAGCVSQVRSCFNSLGLFGLLPHLRRATQVSVLPETEMSITQGLRAAAAGLGFLPMRAWDDTDFLDHRPDVSTVECPYTRETYIAFPAIPIDTALIHVPFADPKGNCVLGSDPGVDVDLSRAAARTIVSTDRIVSTDELRNLGPVGLLGFEVDALVEGEAAPTSSVPHYDLDAVALADWSDN
jgi:glutaconate CoA-transferase, subunit A